MTELFVTGAVFPAPSPQAANHYVLNGASDRIP